MQMKLGPRIRFAVQGHGLTFRKVLDSNDKNPELCTSAEIVVLKDAAQTRYGRALAADRKTLTVEIPEPFAMTLLEHKHALDQLLVGQWEPNAVRLPLRCIDQGNLNWRPQYVLFLKVDLDRIEIRDRATGSLIRKEDVVMKGPCELKLCLMDVCVGPPGLAEYPLRMKLTCLSCDSVPCLAVNMVARGLDLCGFYLPNLFWAQVYARLVS